jgi:hypothetical protein
MVAAYRAVHILRPIAVHSAAIWQRDPVIRDAKLRDRLRGGVHQESGGCDRNGQHGSSVPGLGSVLDLPAASNQLHGRPPAILRARASRTRISGPDRAAAVGTRRKRWKNPIASRADLDYQYR